MYAIGIQPLCVLSCTLVFICLEIVESLCVNIRRVLKRCDSRYHQFLIFSIKDIQTKLQLVSLALRCLVALIRALRRLRASGWTRRLVIRSNYSAVIQCKWTAARSSPSSPLLGDAGLPLSDRLYLSNASDLTCHLSPLNAWTVQVSWC